MKAKHRWRKKSNQFFFLWQVQWSSSSIYSYVCYCIANIPLSTHLHCDHVIPSMIRRPSPVQSHVSNCHALLLFGWQFFWKWFPPPISLNVLPSFVSNEIYLCWPLPQTTLSKKKEHLMNDVKHTLIYQLNDYHINYRSVTVWNVTIWGAPEYMLSFEDDQYV